MTLNTIWYLNATYTLRDATATLEKYSKPLAYSYGTIHYWLGINRYTYPIVTGGKNFNQKMSEKLRSENILLLDRRNILKDRINYSIDDNDVFYSGDTTKAAIGLGVIKVLGVEIDKRMIKHLSYLRLAPYPFSNVFRDEINLYSLQPGSFLP